MSIEGYLNKHIDKNRFIGKNVFITGGNSGIGFELANILAGFNANIFLLCRSIEKAQLAKEKIIENNKNAKVEIIQLDLASFDSIKNAVEEIKKYDVNYFINNAGVFHLPKSITKDGYEIIMGTNYLGSLYLNDLLIPYLKSLNHEVNVLFETSITSKIYKINYNDFFLDKHYKQMRIYANSKTAINNMYYTYIDENSDSNISFSLAHPGGTYTPLISKGYKNIIVSKLAPIFMKIFFHSPKKASLCLLKGISENKNTIIGPRGLFELSGYPHYSKFKKDKKYLECISYGRHLIQEKVGKNNE